jgi:tellurite resistance protein
MPHRSMTALSNVATAVREAGTKISTAVGELQRREDAASSWMQRFILREIEHRSSTRGKAYWDAIFPGLAPEQRATQRIGRMLTRATVAGVAAAAGASSAEVLSITTDGAATAAAVPIGIISVGAELLYTTALQIDLAFDLASIYEVPFAADDVGEISTMLAQAVGVDLVREPTQHDQPVASDEDTKPWRVLRQMQRHDFSKRVSAAVVQQSILRNVVPVAGVLVSAVWNQIMLRRFARQVHTAVRQRRAIIEALRDVRLADAPWGRVVLEGAWLIATADGDLGHYEALALSTLIDALKLPDRIGVREASFSDDEEGWFKRIGSLDEATRAVLIDVLALMASADGEFSTPERRFLRRVATALDRDIDLLAVERSVASLRVGGALRVGKAQQVEAASPTGSAPLPALELAPA